MTTVRETLQKWRSDEEEWKGGEFGAWEAASTLAESADLELRKPRLTGVQIYRTNVPSQTVDEYFKRAIWFPYLDSVTTDLLGN